jgi:hypothetical protein
VRPNRTQTSRTQREHSAWRQTAILFVFLIAADLTQNFLPAGINPSKARQRECSNSSRYAAFINACYYPAHRIPSLFEL